MADQEEIFFVGETLKGKKLHRGNRVVPYLRDDGILVVATHCGNQMTAWEEGNRPPASKVEAACMVCFRQDAWDSWQQAAKGQVLIESRLADRLLGLAETAETTDMGAIRLVDKIRGIARELQKGVLGEEEVSPRQLRRRTGSFAV